MEGWKEKSVPRESSVWASFRRGQLVLHMSTLRSQAVCKDPVEPELCVKAIEGKLR